MLRDGPWADRPNRIDRTTVRLPTPDAFKGSVKEPAIDVLPLVKDPKAQHPAGWCTYSEAFDSPETEVLCGGINSKTATAAAIWRQGHLLHFGFDLSPDTMNPRGRELLVNAIVYIARFTEDRPMTHAPGRSLFRSGADRVTAKKEAEKDYVEWYFAPSARKQGKVQDWTAFQDWYKQNRDYLRADPKQAGSLVLDEEARSLGTPPCRPEFFKAAIDGLKEGGPKAEAAATLLRRYAPDGPEGTRAETWQRWWDENQAYLFFSESGWYRWYVDLLAKKRGVATADLRGARRATRGD